VLDAVDGAFAGLSQVGAIVIVTLAEMTARRGWGGDGRSKPAKPASDLRRADDRDRGNE
jgi:hypothetical protein